MVPIDEHTYVLVVAPHADDEAFGAGGTIAKWTGLGARVDLVVMAIGIGHFDPIRARECSNSCDILGITSERHLFAGKDTGLDTIPQAEMVTALDYHLHEEHYSYILIPYPSQHKDHKVTHEACLAALRTGNMLPCPNVFMYEYAYPDYNNSGGKFYVDITGTINAKMMTLRTYKSCLKSYPHPASLEAAKILARMRGLAIQVPYAEMFHVIQMVDY